MTATPVDVHSYYRQVTDIDIGEIARELLGPRIIQESRQTLFCDCPNHASQSHRSLHISIEEQCWCCWGCGVGGDVLQLVEFVHHGLVTRGQSGRMPESHRAARDFLAARAGLPPLSKLASPEDAEESYRSSLRVRETLTAVADAYHQRLMGNAEVLKWFRMKYGVGEETVGRLKIGFADNSEPSVARVLMDGPGAFTMRDLTATSVFRPTAQDGIIPFFDGRIVFPYWSRGRVVFMIGRRTPWTPDHEWEKSKYKKLAVRNGRNNEHVAECIRNDVLYNEDALLTRPERVVITEGVTDCISLMEHGFAAVSPVTVQIREADWERLLPKLAGVKTVFICQDNEISEAGAQGALKTARVLADHGITTRVAVLPLGEKHRAAREKLAGIPEGSSEADELLADAKIDVNEFFASGKTAADFEAILEAAQTPIELAISRLNSEIPDADLSRIVDPILAEVGRLHPIEQDRHLKLIQSRIGKSKVPVGTLRKQLKVVELNAGTRRRYGHGAAATGADDSHAAEETLPAIQINNRQLYRIARDAWGAIQAMNGDLSAMEKLPYFLFQRRGSLVRLFGNQQDGIEIQLVAESSLFALLVLAANWVKVTEEAVLNVHPPADLTRVMSNFPDSDLPGLEAILRTPVFGRSGKLIADAGYHSDERVWLMPLNEIDLSQVPEAPSEDAIAAARSLLLEDLLGDFPFVSRSDAAHVVAAMILPFARRLFSGPSPIHLIEAPRQGSGKGLLANVISLVSHGVPCDTKTLPDSEDEIRKLLTTELLKARPVILLDNVDERKPIISRSLASVITAEIWSDRMLGLLDDVRMPNLSLWLMTGNNPKLVGDFPRRCIRIRIDPKRDRPWKRAGFRHPDLQAWIRENRAKLVEAVVVLVKAWLAAGRPLHAVRLGSFEGWSATIGGILDATGIPGFLDSLDELCDASDPDAQAWRQFTVAWWEAFEKEPKKVADLNQLCEREGLMLDVRGDGSERSQQIRLGKALANRRDQVFDRFQIMKVEPPRDHRGTTMFALLCRDVSDCRDVVGMSDSDIPTELTPIEPITCEQVSGMSGCLSNLRAQDSKKENSGADGGQEEFFSEREQEGAPEAKTSRHSRHESVSHTGSETSGVGMFEANIPTDIPRNSDNIPTQPRRGAIDLADLKESDR